MVTFEINDLTCGHCVEAITKAVISADSNAKVEVDLAEHRVHIDADVGNLDAFRDAIESAGFTPSALAPGAILTSQTKPRTGCCCG